MMLRTAGFTNAYTRYLCARTMRNHILAITIVMCPLVVVLVFNLGYWTRYIILFVPILYLVYTYYCAFVCESVFFFLQNCNLLKQSLRQ